MPADFLEHPDFKDLLNAGPILPFIGAGFSMGEGGCPSWGGFLDKLHSQVKDMMTDADVELYRTLQGDGGAADYEAILDLLFTCAGKGKRERLIKSLFDIELPPAFKIKFELFHQAFPGPWITTNLDRFIEKSYPSAHNPINGNDPTGLKEQLNQSDKRGLLLKIHGDVTAAKSWVLSKEEYQQAYGSEQSVDLTAPLPEFLKRLYTNYTLLFIGCSLQDDRPLQVLKQVMDEEGTHQHFALLKRPAKQDDEHKLFERRLSNLNITPIWLNDHAEVDDVLKHLAPTTKPAAVEKVAEPDIFVGRDKELKQLTEALSKPGRVHAVSGKLVNLIGLGGIGKTTLAREALKRCKHNFPDGCFEIRLEGMSPQGFAVKLNGLLNQSPSEPADVEQAQLQITQLLNQHQILLLLDNVIDANELLQVLPQNCKSSIVVTSRDLDLAETLRIKRRNLTVSSSHLEEFNNKECLELFSEFLGDDYQSEQDETYLAIAQQLGFLPIALRLAMTTLKFGPKHSPTQLLNILKSDQKFTLIDKALKHDANSDERSISAVFDLSAPLLDESLKQTLAELAVCASGPVPVDFLQHLTVQDDLADSLETLVRYSWCKQICVDDVQHYELHQLVRELIQEQLVRDELQEHHIATVQKVFIEEPAHFLERERWLGQADLILLVLKERKDRRLARWAGGNFYTFCINRGYGERFFEICQWVIECFKEYKGIVAMALGNQGGILRLRGLLDEAMALHQKEEVIGEAMKDRAMLASCYGNQAIIFSDKGLLDEAMALHQKEEFIYEALDDQLRLSTCYGNQALILRERGMLDEAMVIFKKEEVIKEALADLGGLSRNYNNQAGILADKYQLDDAMTLYKKVELIRDELGDRGGLADCYGNQAIIYYERREFDEAMTLILKQEAICEALGDLSSLALCYWNKGTMLGELGEVQKQKELCVKSIEINLSIGIPTGEFQKQLDGLLERLKEEGSRGHA